MSKKVMAICGDSFAAPVCVDVHGKNYAENIGREGTHFSELLSRQLEYDLLPLARGGTCNHALRLQVETAIDAQVDFIWLTDTGADRIIFDMSGEFDWRQGAYNIEYYAHGDLSSTNEKFCLNNVYSETLSNVLPRETPQGESWPDVTRYIGQNKLDAIQQYFKHLYNKDYKDRLDSWVLAGLIHELNHSGIPYLFLLNWHWKSYPEIARLMGDRIPDVEVHPELWPRHYQGNDPDGSRYHTGIKEQIQIFQHNYNYIMKKGLLKADV